MNGTVNCVNEMFHTQFFGLDEWLSPQKKEPHHSTEWAKASQEKGNNSVEDLAEGHEWWNHFYYMKPEGDRK